MGAQLLSVLYATWAARFFSPATASQLKLSRGIADQIARQGLGAIRDAMKAALERDTGWIAAARNALIEATYSTGVSVDPIASAQRSAFDASRRGRFDDAECSTRADRTGSSKAGCSNRSPRRFITSIRSVVSRS